MDEEMRKWRFVIFKFRYNTHLHNAPVRALCTHTPMRYVYPCAHSHVTRVYIYAHTRKGRREAIKGLRKRAEEEIWLFPCFFFVALTIMEKIPERILFSIDCSGLAFLSGILHI